MPGIIMSIPNTYMKEYIQQLSKTSCDALNYCIGKPIQSVLSPSSDLRLGSTIVTTQSVSIRIGTREFLVIENDWADTPKEYHDYYFLEASISDRPKEITVNAQKSSPCWSYLLDHFCLSLGARSEIACIDVLEEKYEGESESVQYDAALAFYLENGVNFVVAREQSISGLMEIAHTEETVREFSEENSVRLQFRYNKAL